MKVKEEIGNKYGKLTVIARADSTKDGKATWLCKCDCGNKKVVIGDLLRRNQVTSCGCMKAIRGQKVGKNNALDISGMVFGKLTAIKPIGTATYGGILWEC